MSALYPGIASQRPAVLYCKDLRGVRTTDNSSPNEGAHSVRDPGNFHH